MTAVENMLSSNYLYDFDKTKLRDDAIKAYVDGLDEPYTHYYTQSEFSSYISNIQDGYVGIGIIVGVNDDNQIEVVAPFEDSPAYNAGIQPSDIIKAIDGVEYSGDKLSEAVDNIKNGEIGTTVDIKILRGEEELDITVTRDDIASMLDEYEKDYKCTMEVKKIAELIYEYTSGYPYLVSKICKLIDERCDQNWTKQGVLEAIKILLKETNTLFDDLRKKITDYKELKNMLYSILFQGESISI